MRVEEREGGGGVKRAREERGVVPAGAGCVRRPIAIAQNGASRSDKTPDASAWVAEGGITLGQIVTEEKSNEITAIPELLKTIDSKRW